ncbi:polyprenyl synthetase family protein [Streptomyces sp. NPDC006372]|uniref:polyprenyl synthetase family protein n=1 Tax=Streptomyces sp. NPDC006372 TaxID=3155599 RepID=UPI0033A26914
MNDVTTVERNAMCSTRATFRHSMAPPGGLAAHHDGHPPASPDRVATDAATGRDPSADPHDADRPGTLGHDEGCRDPGGAGTDPRVVDADVTAAIRAVLDRLLATRLARARQLDPLFAEDLAARVADFTRRGGRRIRPRLLWWSLRACGGGTPAQVRATLHAGAALELLQTCALVHDDLMDAATTRRGRPALHTAVAHQYGDTGPGVSAHPNGGSTPGVARRLGDAAAVLAGDLALAWADDVMTDLLLNGDGLPPEALARVRDIWRGTRTEMVAGQYLDIQGQATGRPTPNRALRSACLKSARYTVERPLALGAALAGAGQEATRALCRAGRCAGVAFQLRDDLDDLFADPDVTGKPSGGDVREGKPTYLMAVARARAAADGDRAALGVLDAALGRGDLTESGLDRVRDVLTATGTRDLVQEKTERLCRQALRHLAAADPEPGPAAALRTLLTAITGTPGQAAGPAGGLPVAAAPGTGGAESSR